MKSEFWLKIEAKKNRYRRSEWVSGGVEVRKSKPATKAHEVAVKVNFIIPDSYFETPEIKANVTISEDMVNRPEITPEVQDNISQLIADQIGVAVRISVDEKLEGIEDN